MYRGDKMKKYFSLIFVFALMLLVSGCGSKSSNVSKEKSIKVDDDMTITYKIDAPYYGDIKVGNTSFDMLSTKDMLKEHNIETNMFRVAGYKVKGTDDNFFYETIKYDSAYEVKFVAHSDLYNNVGCEDCDEQLVSSLELPKGVTFNSTVDDVTKAYGEATEKNEYPDNSYQWSKKTDGEELGGIESTELTYVYNTDKVEMRLELWFAKSTGKLHRVNYEIEVKK
jgi:hypothetical protein